MKPTIKQLQTTIKAKDAAIKYYFRWRETLIGVAKDQADIIIKQGKTIKDLRAIIKVLGKALVESERDYNKLKRTRKRK